MDLCRALLARPALVAAAAAAALADTGTPAPVRGFLTLRSPARPLDSPAMAAAAAAAAAAVEVKEVPIGADTMSKLEMYVNHTPSAMSLAEDS
jgi:hypothetical protein